MGYRAISGKKPLHRRGLRKSTVERLIGHRVPQGLSLKQHKANLERVVLRQSREFASKGWQVTASEKQGLARLRKELAQMEELERALGNAK